MATINGYTMLHRQLTPFFVKTAQGGLRQLPYFMVTIDHDWQAYMPCHLGQFDQQLNRMQGEITAPMILDMDRALPIPQTGVKNPDSYSVFEYHGI